MKAQQQKRLFFFFLKRGKKTEQIVAKSLRKASTVHRQKATTVQANMA